VSARPGQHAAIADERRIYGVMDSTNVAAKVLRFVLIGLLNGTIYAGVTATLVSGFGIAPVAASIVGYCVSVPAGFVGHRHVSFRSSGRWIAEAMRFVVAQAFNIAVTAGSMHAAVNWFGALYYWGMVFTVILVPIANFLVMNFWVFRNQTEKAGQ